AGARVWVTDVDRAALDGCPEAWGRTVLDVRDEAGTAALLARIDAEWGGLDTACANAGIAGPTAPVEAMPLEGFRDCVGVNLEGAFLAAKHAAPLMTRQGAGCILLTSSTAGLHGFPNRAPYAAAKWA